MDYLTVGLRGLVGVVFLVSFISKVRSRDAFRTFGAFLRDLRLLPTPLVRPVALGIAVAECAVCGLLAAPFPAPAAAGFTIAVALLTVFTAGIALLLRRGVRAPCQCFGESAVPIGLRHVVRNVLLAVLAGVGLSTAFAAGPPQVGGAVVATLAGLLLGGLTVSLDDLVELFQPVNSSVPNRLRGVPAVRDESSR
ncbi:MULTISPECIES: MauE/DoxX family redox-associated membrane protein [unclassified Streptomyces]|uniref:MauE/DoxX family redox-associated membrane protein n=1 Tax=unclassified Streptomyces TaxID=2593676 RepID=UPI000FA0A511|nr:MULTISPECIES: MauE/DoxX family redox-associated membrane protein [unclassified Streptomyces]MCX4774949.1 hypothetical protein [Streptomyces sp. NBC_01285]ROQ78393.1 methylamine utilization protein MauE [Streptomyces sp. CEV 2-1]